MAYQFERHQGNGRYQDLHYQIIWKKVRDQWHNQGKISAKSRWIFFLQIGGHFCKIRAKLKIRGNLVKIREIWYPTPALHSDCKHFWVYPFCNCKIEFLGNVYARPPRTESWLRPVRDLGNLDTKYWPSFFNSWKQLKRCVSTTTKWVQIWQKTVKISHF